MPTKQGEACTGTPCGCPKPEPPTGIAVVASPYAHHEDALLVGDLPGLLAIRDAINQAIAYGQAAARELWAPDGEGYDLLVICLPTEQAWLLPTTYTADYCQPQNEVGDHQQVAAAIRQLYQDRRG